MSISKTGMNDGRDSISVWRVYLPLDMDRENYVKSCYATGTISLINDNAEIIHRVEIGKLAIQLVIFPIDRLSLGSKVLCVTLPYSAEIKVIDVFTKQTESIPQSENQYRFSKSADGNSAEMLIDGANGRISISVDSDDESLGELNVSITNKTRTGKLNINVNGTISVYNDGNTTLKSTGTVLVDSPKILLNDSDEPILLGTKTVKLISDLLDQLNKESAGPYPLVGAAVYAELKKNIEDLKSQISFVK